MYRFCTVYSFRICMFLAVIAGACVLPAYGLAATSRNRAQVYTDPDAYAVYSAVLPQMWPWVQLDARHLVIRETTKARVVCSAPDKNAPGGETSKGTNPDGAAAASAASDKSAPDSTASAVEQYNRVNRHSWLLSRKLNISRTYTLIGGAELERIAHHEIGAWDLFFERHADSGGWIQFSAVGFSPDKKTAVVYAEYACGRQCGDGALYLLHKHGDRWTVTEPPTNSCSKKRTDRQMTGL